MNHYEWNIYKYFDDFFKSSLEVGEKILSKCISYFRVKFVLEYTIFFHCWLDYSAISCDMNVMLQQLNLFINVYLVQSTKQKVYKYFNFDNFLFFLLKTFLFHFKKLYMKSESWKMKCASTFD